MSSYVTKKTQGDTAWFTHDRFGMFIHFGLYSMPARHKWVKSVEKNQRGTLRQDKGTVPGQGDGSIVSE